MRFLAFQALDGGHVTTQVQMLGMFLGTLATHKLFTVLPEHPLPEGHQLAHKTAKHQVNLQALQTR